MWHTDYKTSMTVDGSCAMLAPGTACLSTPLPTRWPCLEEAIKNHGKPASIMTVPVYANALKKKGASVFEKKLVDLE